MLNKFLYRHKTKFLIIVLLSLAIFLRFYKQDSLPPSLYWEEVALGYDAYSILETGRDHHGNLFPIVAFESFGDWKPSLYFYAIIPFISRLGLSDLAVRLPSIISGIFIVIGTGVLVYQISNKKRAGKLLLLAMLLTSISPWAIQFSRAAWEVNLATALILWGVILFIKLINSKRSVMQWSLLFGSILLLSLSMYAYHAARIIAPLLGLALVVLWLAEKTYSNIKNNLFQIIAAVLLSLLLISPLINGLRQSKTTQRFKETSIFYNLDIIEESNARIETNNFSLISKVFYHRYVLFSREILKNIFSYFDIDFLFISGDQNPRHSSQYFGTFYHIEFIFLLFGAYYLFKNWNKYHAFLIFWLFIGLIPASISKTNPHALRILPTLPVWILIISLGTNQLLIGFGQLFLNKNIKKYALTIFILIISLTYLFEFLAFWQYYSNVYPKQWGSEWQYGYKELVSEISSLTKNSENKQVYITREQGRPAMYYWFYSSTNPALVQNWQLHAKKDQGEFLEFENIKFENPPEQSDEPMIIASSLIFQENYCEKIQNNTCKIKNEILGLDGKTIWIIYELN
ncbi:MAG: hypothetical protein ABFQ62_00410 [Patescibacteria group bacterium]